MFARTVKEHEFYRYLATSLLAIAKKDKIGGFTTSDIKQQVTSHCKDISKRVGVKEPEKYPPCIELTDDLKRVRLMAVTINDVVFVCVGHVEIHHRGLDEAIKPTQIVPDKPACAPAAYVDATNGLGITRLVRDVLRMSEVSKVVLCGHGFGGNIAHIAHYQLLTNPAYDNVPSEKILSLAMGSTPFLNCDQPLVSEAEQRRFVTYFLPNDSVPMLFDTEVRERRREQLHNDLVLVFPGLNLTQQDGLRETASLLSRYKRYGTWIRARDNSISDDPVTEVLRECKDTQDGHKAHGMDLYVIPVPRVSVLNTIVDPEVAKKVHDKVHFSVRTHVMTAEISPTCMPLLINQALGASVVTSYFGSLEILNAVKELVAEIKKYSILQAHHDPNGKHELSQELVTAFEEMKDFATRVSERRFEEDEKGDILPYFNDHNIKSSMSTITTVTASVLSKEMGVDKKLKPTSSGWEKATLIVLGGVAGVAAFMTGGAAIAAVSWLATSLYGFGATFIGLLSVSFLAVAFETSTVQIISFVKRERVETYRDISSAYDLQLKTAAKLAKLYVSPNDTSLDLEKKLAKHMLPKDINKDVQALLTAFIECIKKLVALREKCLKLVFIAVHGEQCVGKSWFVKAINECENKHRNSTDYPTFMRHVPNGAEDPSSLTIIVDMPGENSDREDTMKFISELFGVASIGIQLFPFDVRPPQLNTSAIHNTFNGCGKVLICLNKVMSSTLDMDKVGVLRHCMETWRAKFRIMGLDMNGKYTMFATDMVGSHELPKPIPGHAEFLKTTKEYNLKWLREQGGHSREEVIQWIDKAVATILEERAEQLDGP